MANKYCYSREIDTIEGKETFAVADAHSFDEAKKEVDKGIRDRRLELAEKHFDVKLDPPPQVGPAMAPTKAEAGYNALNATPGSNPPADLPDSPDKLPERKGWQFPGRTS